MDNKKKIGILLGLVIALGFVIRIIAANNLGMAADDTITASQAINFIDSGLIQTFNNPALWYLLTDALYKVFGVGQVTSRLVGVLFGTLLIPLLFLISGFFFSKKISLIPAFFVAISPMLIHTGSTAEMDVPMLFFVLLAQYFFLNYLKTKKVSYFMLVPIAFGVSFLFKYLAVFFLPSILILFFIYSKQENKQFRLFTVKNLKLAILFGGIFFLFIIPPLAYNYLLYSDKGYLDFQFARFTGKSKEIYQGLGGIDEKFDFRSISGLDGHHFGARDGIKFYWKDNPLLLVLGLLGLVLSFIANKKIFHFCWPSLLFPFLFVAEASIMPKHFVFAIPYFSLLSTSLLKYIDLKLNKKKIAIFLLLLLLIFASLLSFLNLKEERVFFKSSVGQFMSFKTENIPVDSVFIADSRIYRGQIVWMLNDMNYMEAPQGIELLNNLDKIPGDSFIADVYFLECGSNDCGWGTIPEGSQLDKNMESFFEGVKEQAMKVEYFVKRDGSVYISLYKTSLQLKEGIIPIIKSSHVWFYTPVRYENMDNFIFSYGTSTLFQKLLNMLAKIILWLSFILASLSVFYLFYKLKLSFKD
ncbi:MAG: glycosyltransferase family 39 protein [Candidatus Woesearchaeota archaeon]